MGRVSSRRWLPLVVVASAACSGGAPETAPTSLVTTATPPAATADQAGAPVSAPRAAPSAPSLVFPTAPFARISEGPVTDEAAAAFQALLDDMAGDGGMAATVMTSDGTWSGATGTADGVRPVQIDDQFSIGSVTKSLVAAQVLQLVDEGQLALDDPAADYLPADLDFDTNGATIRQLLSHRSGLREPDTFIWPTLRTDRLHAWTTNEVLELAGEPGWPAGTRFEYSNANYFLLGLIIEQVRGHPLGEVLRDGVLAVDGTQRLIYQPDERPTEPMAMPAGESDAALERGGGYLPSIASATGGGPAAAMASDAPSLARWWRTFCAGEVVSAASLTEMAAIDAESDGYGLGLMTVDDAYPESVGHVGEDYGYSAWAGCVPELGAVVVVLTNQEIDDKGGIAHPLLKALASR